MPINNPRFVAVALSALFVACGSDSSDGSAGSGGTRGPSGAGGTPPTELVAPLETTYATAGGDVYTECRGSTTGLPVILLAGGADRADTWDELRDGLGEGVLSCAFTRPGASPSYLRLDPYTPQLFADALAEVLPQLEIGDRFIFVAHSLNGLTLRVFGDANAAQIAGALFLDPTVPSEDPVIIEELALFNIDGVAAASEGAAVSSWTGSSPIVVLSHDPAWALGSGLYTEEQQAEWDDGQLDYAALTDNGRQRDVAGAEHYVFRTNLDEVVDEIEALLGDE